MYPNDHRNIHLYMMVTVFNMVFETFSTQSVISTCKELCIGSDRATGVTPSRWHRPGAAQVQRHTDWRWLTTLLGGLLRRALHQSCMARSGRRGALVRCSRLGALRPALRLRHPVCKKQLLRSCLRLRSGHRRRQQRVRRPNPAGKSAWVVPSRGGGRCC